MQVGRRWFVGALGGAGAFASMVGCAPVVAAVPRRVLRIVPPRATRVGEVFRVRRTVPGAGVDQVDPFVLLDHFDFTLAPGERGGLAPHPHRGQETVTVLLEGAIEHGDSLGNRGVIEGGGVQWMTAASGIVHEENPADILREKGGRVQGVQLWVNLPRAAKSAPPGYQDRVAAQIPAAEDAGVQVRVIAGAVGEVRSPLITQSPLALLDVAIPPGGRADLPLPAGWTAFVHVLSGDIDVGGTAIGEATLGQLDTSGDAVVLTAGPRGARVLVGGGQPIAEPIARGGPFVMNTEDEIGAAYADYRAGRMGRVANPTYDRIRL
jgi:redox-sensitive bicupin YhaK (pirin superfamily)